MIKSPTVDKADLPFSDLWSTEKAANLWQGRPVGIPCLIDGSLTTATKHLADSKAAEGPTHPQKLATIKERTAFLSQQ
jgi:hypothetical protein